MEPLTQTRFHAAVLCFQQGDEVQKIELVRCSFAQNTPHLETLQSPHMEFSDVQNDGMGKTTRENIAARLD